jgi:hypothetical protein
MLYTYLYIILYYIYVNPWKGYITNIYVHLCVSLPLRMLLHTVYKYAFGLSPRLIGGSGGLYAPVWGSVCSGNIHAICAYI